MTPSILNSDSHVSLHLPTNGGLKSKENLIGTMLNNHCDYKTKQKLIKLKFLKTLWICLRLLKLDKPEHACKNYTRALKTCALLYKSPWLVCWMQTRSTGPAQIVPYTFCSPKAPWDLSGIWNYHSRMNELSPQQSLPSTKNHKPRLYLAVWCNLQTTQQKLEQFLQ